MTEISRQNPDITLQAITANLAALSDVLQVASTRAAEGLKYAQQGEQNMAIGSAYDLDELLAQATALFGAAMALHRKK